MKLLYGKLVAEKILDRTSCDISLRAEKPGLAVVLVGDDEASKLYVTLKEKKAHEIGMNFFRHDFASSATQDEILQQIQKLNLDEKVHGIIVQLPLPAGFDQQRIISSIDPKKDADGFHPVNTALFLKGDGQISPVFPLAIVSLIESVEEKQLGKKGIVIANSDDFGRIMCAQLERKGIISQYILAEDVSSNLDQIKAANIVVSAVGSPGLFGGEMLASGATVIDGGISKVNEKVFGDVDFGSLEAFDGYITPVPGGVGPVTIACLLRNVYLAFEAQQKGK